MEWGVVSKHSVPRYYVFTVRHIASVIIKTICMFQNLCIFRIVMYNVNNYPLGNKHYFLGTYLPYNNKFAKQNY